ncbi:hypothetical protein COCVIDRAFT_105937 [Bipolaris victoriae FI3]|uniref:Uncharacterized protein n=1 Tax=Bipolaris victoriae (strain FI3) TaxID=930091 RepID=W7E8N0_BIPV3|nr:hypothetical protein COCVIDRAFT_105937 [Bipolaris victoriae FI3]
MPKWTPELDAIILHGVFEECNISFSKSLCAKIAQRVNDAGVECTPKAIENRLYSWKKKNVSGATGLNSATSTPVQTPATPKTPRSRVKAKAEDPVTPSPSVRKRKASKLKTEPAESQSEENSELDDMLAVKKMKTEPVEEGLSLDVSAEEQV